jgi:hypothetical protein
MGQQGKRRHRQPDHQVPAYALPDTLDTPVGANCAINDIRHNEPLPETCWRNLLENQGAPAQLNPLLKRAACLPLLSGGSLTIARRAAGAQSECCTAENHTVGRPRAAA